ncbi:MAG: hypothetical protein RSE93_04780, partial [Oscillospiraceae bacterium]
MTIEFLVILAIITIVQISKYKKQNIKYRIYSAVISLGFAFLNLFVIEYFNLSEQIDIIAKGSFGLGLLGELLLFSPAIIVAILIENKFKIDKWIYGDKLTITK